MSKNNKLHELGKYKDSLKYTTAQFERQVISSKLHSSKSQLMKETHMH